MKRIIACLLGLTLVSYVLADEVYVACAANFIQPAQQIAKVFEQKTGHTVLISSGSTGKFYTQIKKGAPFDVFLAADSKTPKKLEKEQETVLGSRFTYAKGKLVLFSLTEKDPLACLQGKNFSHLAIASPQLAPYGQAAKETLTHLGLWKEIQEQLVIGENIAQAFQFVDSKNAPLGFVALSQTRENASKGFAWLVPNDYYNPIFQDAVLLKKGENNQAAKLWMTFLKDQEALSIIRNFGYE